MAQPGASQAQGPEARLRVAPETQRSLLERLLFRLRWVRLHHRREGIWAAFLLCLAACWGVQVRRDVDEAVSFSGYRTFALAGGEVTGAQVGVYDALAEDRIASALRETLVARGLREDAEHPDLLAAFTANVRSREELQVSGLSSSTATGWVDWGPEAWWDPGYPDVKTRRYPEGTLAVTLTDARTRRTVWRSDATAELWRGALSGDRGEARLARLLAKMFRTFPPEPARAAE